MHGKRVLRVERDQQVQLHADLSDFCTGLANDLVVTSDGDAYVGHLGFDFFGGERFRTAELLHVSPDGYVEVAADGLAVPNGCIVSPDRTELVVAETFAGGLTRFDRDEGGKLSGRAPWAKLPGASPDGICSAGDGAIWVADPVGSRVMKVQRGGIVEMEIATPAPVYSCALGGHEGTTLFAGVADGHDPAVTPPGTGCILSVELDG
jgi:sugar lactone lactonase YvrE